MSRSCTQNPQSNQAYWCKYQFDLFTLALEQALDRIELLLSLLVSKNEIRYRSLGELITDLTQANYDEKVCVTY
jgi:hypothetical protein